MKRIALSAFALTLNVAATLLTGGKAAAEAAVDLGLCNQWGRGNPNEKINVCTTLIESGRYLGNDLANIYVMRGRIHFFSKGDIERAVAEYNETLKIAPSNCAAFYFRSIISGSKDNADDAIADLNKAIGYCPTVGVYHRQRGVAHYAKLEFDQAIADFDEAIRLDQEDASALLLRGMAKLTKGDTEGSNADKDRLEELLARGPR